MRDSHFLIGSTHLVCEDYCLTGETSDLEYAIVCDGCSSSKNTDFGSRILANSFKHTIEKIYQIEYKDFQDTSYFSILKSIFLEKSINLISLLGLSIDCLFCTVVIAIKHKISGAVYVSVMGDGGFKIEFSDKISHTVLVNCNNTNNAPFYPIYVKNNSLHDSYISAFDTGVVSIEPNEHILDRSTHFTLNFKGADFTFTNLNSKAEYVPLIKTISIFSDGVESFSEEMVSMDFQKAIDMLTDFPNINGDFVKRNLKFYQKDWKKKNISHSDDISIACITDDND